MFVKSKLKGSVLLFVSMLLLVAGCQGGEDVDVNQLVKDAIVNNGEITSQSSVIDINLAGSVEEEGEVSEADANLVIEGYFAQTADLMPQFDITLNGNFNLAEGENRASGVFDLAARMVENDLYVIINDFPEQALGPYSQIVSALKEQWWQFAIPEDAFAGLSPEVTAEQDEQVRQILEEVDIFESLSVEGSETVNGLDSYRVSGQLSQTGLLEYIERVSELAENPVPEEDKADLNRVLEMLAGSDVEMWISKDDNYFTRFVFDMEFTMEELAAQFETEPVEGQELPEGEIALGVVVDISDINQEQTIEVPADAQEFNLEDAVQQSGLVPPTVE